MRIVCLFYFFPLPGLFNFKNLIEALKYLPVSYTMEKNLVAANLHASYMANFFLEGGLEFVVISMAHFRPG